jgi:hypothetical protein
MILWQKLLQYDWFYKLILNFTRMEYFVIVIFIGLIVWM